MYLFKSRVEGDPEKNESNSVFWQHSKADHGGLMRTSDWEVKITSSHRSPLSRQVTEAFRISQELPANILNAKSEFRANNFPELEIRYGIRVGNGGLKRKRIQEVELAVNVEEDVNENGQGEDSISIISSETSLQSDAAGRTELNLQLQHPPQAGDVSGTEILSSGT